MVELPHLLIQNLIYCVIVYTMVGFEWTAVKFTWYLFFMYFTLLYYTFFGMVTVAVTPNHNIAAIILSLFFTLWNLFSGFMISKTVSTRYYLMKGISNNNCGLILILFFFFSFYNREYQYGGFGIITSVPLLGQCMDWLLHSLET